MNEPVSTGLGNNVCSLKYTKKTGGSPVFFSLSSHVTCPRYIYLFFTEGGFEGGARRRAAAPPGAANPPKKGNRARGFPFLNRRATK